MPMIRSPLKRTTISLSSTFLSAAGDRWSEANVERISGLIIVHVKLLKLGNCRKGFGHVFSLLSRSEVSEGTAAIVVNPNFYHSIFTPIAVKAVSLLTTIAP